jgi:hypothetical protein
MHETCEQRQIVLVSYNRIVDCEMLELEAKKMKRGSEQRLDRLATAVITVCWPMGYAESTSRDYCSLAGGKLPAVPPRCASTTTEWLCHACCYDVPRMAQRTSSMLSGLRRTKILL